MKIGFTGTRQGLTDPQMMALTEWVLTTARTVTFDEFHHGDCVGADAEAHWVVLRASTATIIIHPPNRDGLRAFCHRKSNLSTRRSSVLQPKEYLKRNRDIVDAVDLMLVCPAQLKEEKHSGTWATERYAKRKNKPRVIIYPNGKVEHK